jgi:hypothetical protein
MERSYFLERGISITSDVIDSGPTVIRSSRDERRNSMASGPALPFLKRVLIADAAATGITGLLMALFPRMLADLLVVSGTLLFWAGLFLVLYAAGVGYLALRDPIPRPAVAAVIACNVLWGVTCLALVLSGGIAPNALGYAFIGLQIVVVAAFAELQWAGLRRTPATA